MKNTINIVSMSGGKDSTATALLALERGVDNLRFVFADTGNEHEITYEYLGYLEEKLGISITRVKADFSEEILRKKEITVQKWRADGAPDWIVDLAKEHLIPTGIPFLDLCLWKGRFPSTKSAFCTEELKIQPITNQVILPLLSEFDEIKSWQGVRWQESKQRSTYVESEGIEPDAMRVFAYRPILAWTADEVFEFHRRHGIKWNPLYEMGMGRVGCMPCINARKEEISNIAAKFPEVIDRIREWEALVSMAGKRGSSTFFCATNDPTVSADDDIHYTTHGIDRIVQWSNTERGGRKMSIIATDADQSKCSSIYGLCE